VVQLQNIKLTINAWVLAVYGRYAVGERSRSPTNRITAMTTEATTGRKRGAERRSGVVRESRKDPLLVIGFTSAARAGRRGEEHGTGVLAAGGISASAAESANDGK